jgi:hypothetical protein|eukprot:COSAG06_NODE_727_length_12752_cov_61.232277_4_plen_94_part_00
MIRGVAESSVYLLYLTHDALSYLITIEARAAMMLSKPVIVLMENDSQYLNRTNRQTRCMHYIAIALVLPRRLVRPIPRKRLLQSVSPASRTES